MTPKQTLLLGLASAALFANTGCIRLTILVPPMPYPGAGATGSIAPGTNLPGSSSPGLPGAAGPSIPTSSPAGFPVGPQVPGAAVQTPSGWTPPAPGAAGPAVPPTEKSLPQGDGSSASAGKTINDDQRLLGWASYRIQHPYITGGNWAASLVQDEVGERAARIAMECVLQQGAPYQTEGCAALRDAQGEYADGLMRGVMRRTIKRLRNDFSREGLAFQQAEADFVREQPKAG
jgi:hypothetical protein